MQRESNWSVSGDQRVALRTRRPPPASCATNAAAELHISPCAADRALSVYCACYTFSSSSRVLTNAIITLEWEPSPRSSFAMSVFAWRCVFAAYSRTIVYSLYTQPAPASECSHLIILPLTRAACVVANWKRYFKESGGAERK